MKNNSRRILFTAGLVAILVVISVLCFIFGRGHTVYLDNKELGNYKPYEFIEVTYKGEKITTLCKEERTVISVIGQKCDIDLVLTKKKNSMDEEEKLSITLPYDMDNIVLNLNAFAEGADQSVYMSEFVSLLDVANEDAGTEDASGSEVNIGDDFGLTAE